MSEGSGAKPLVGGPGGKSRRRGRGVRDVRLAALALAQAWPIPPAAKPAVIARLMKAVEDPEAGHREAIAACKALVDASRVNLAAIGTAIAAEVHESLEARLAELEGIAREHQIEG